MRLMTFAAALAAVASIAAYETFAPLIAAFPFGLLAVHWRNARERTRKRVTGPRRR